MNPKKLLSLLLAVLKGTLVGLAIVIPGVSGGSMLLTIGVYEDAVSITSHDKNIRRAAIKKLIPYAAGIVLGVCVLSFVITWLLEKYEFLTILAFCGLILGSLPMLFKQIKGQKLHIPGLLLSLLMIVIMVALPYLNDTSSERFTRVSSGDTLYMSERVVLQETDAGEALSIGKASESSTVYKLTAPVSGLAGYKAAVSDGVLLENEAAEGEYLLPEAVAPVWNGDGTLLLGEKSYYVYRAEDTLSGGLSSALLALLLGFIAAGTMIIPGISGSMVLLVLGFYHSVIGHLKMLIIAVLTWNVSSMLRHAAVLVPFGIGILLGLLLVSKLVKWLLDKHPVPTYYAIIGLMVSSPYAIFVKATCFGPGFAASLSFVGVVLAVVCLGGGFFLASRMNT